MAGREGHLIKFADVPCADDVAAAMRIFLNLGDHLIDLVDRVAISGAPIAPLSAVDAAEAAFGVGPFVPDADTVLVQVFNIRVAAEEPEQLVNDGFDVD